MAIGRVIADNARQDNSERRRRMVAGAVINPVVSIAITTQPSNTQYANSPLDLTGMVIKATYRDGTEEDVTSKVICNRTTWGSAGVEQSATFGYNEKACVLTVTPTAIALSSIAVKTPPTKTAYKYGEQISLEGCVIEATYNNGSKADKTTGFTASPTTMGADTEAITITYTEGGVTQTATQAVTLVEPESATIKTPADKLTYQANEELDMTGLTLEITYTDESTAIVTEGFEGAPTTILADTTEIVVTYTEGNVSVTTGYDITVTE